MPAHLPPRPARDRNAPLTMSPALALRSPAITAIAVFVALAASCADAPQGSPSPAASSSPIATAAPPSSSASGAPPAAPPPARCDDGGKGPSLFVFPLAPKPGDRVRVVAIADKPIEAISIVDDAGHDIASSTHGRGGPPYSIVAEINGAREGRYRASWGGAERRCEAFAVGPDTPAPKRGWGAAWGVRAEWNKAHEDLYSAWIEATFDAPIEEQLSWAALHDVTRDPSRNFLHDALGQGEDEPGPKAVSIDPDCADLPYFLRAYFAFKMGLPFGYSECSRGGGGQAPSCTKSLHTNLTPRRARSSEMATFGEFLRISVADTVHSGTGRVPASTDEGDYYPVPITWASLRPGTVFADPYGHVLVVAKRVPQSSTSAGILFAVDGQPDGTVARRRFWRGNFLFALDPALGSPGFKRFRPIVITGRGPRKLGNAEIAKHPDYSDVSLDQYEHGVDGFYDKVEDALSPSPLDPDQALTALIDALDEQVKGRVRSVKNGEDHMKKDPARIDMPEGAAIFETTGPWEDYSTPSRDLRLLIAIDVVTRLPDRVAKRPERFAIPRGKSPADASAEVKAKLDRALADRSFDYEKSDGSKVRLTLADVIARAAALEVAYNPNDCVEARWGAPEGSAEMASCKRRAPAGQRARMERQRVWFHERRRPARGL